MFEWCNTVIHTERQQFHRNNQAIKCQVSRVKKKLVKQIQMRYEDMT